MRKLLVLLVVAAFVWLSAAPVSAVDWNFYGSARMATYYTSHDLNDFETAGGDDSDDGLQWEWINGSRIGVDVKGENIRGQVELGVRANDGSDADVSSRRIWGRWYFGEGMYLQVGKDYTPANQFISGQVFNDDQGLLGVGTYYAFRPGAIELGIGGFRLALIDPSTGNLDTALTGTSTGADVDYYLPKVEASWGMAMDNFNFNIIGGFQYYQIADVTSLEDGDQNDIDVTSWMIGLDAGITFGAVYVKGAVSYDQNGGNAGWLSWNGFWDGDDDMEDTNFFQVCGVVGLKMSDMVTFEVGAGWTDLQNDAFGAEEANAWGAYGQAVIALAPGVYIIPEIGYFDYDEWLDSLVEGLPSNGSTFYAGAKWQIDF